MNGLSSGFFKLAVGWPWALRDALLIRRSDLFDAHYYCLHYPDAARFRFGPLAHYVLHGGREGRNPSSNFDGAYYLASYPDVAAARINPLVHYILRGRHEGRVASPLQLPVLQKLGPSPYATELVTWLKSLPPVDPYQAWLAVNRGSPKVRANLAAHLERMPSKKTRFSIVIPVFNPHLHWIERAIESVRNQYYDEWEVCLAEDAGDRPEIRQFLERLAAAESGRFKVAFRPVRGHISEATNSAAALATGDFIVFLDQDDELAPEALAEVALHLAANPDTDMLYSDSDKIDAAGRRFDPHFKPDWSPELLLVYMYAGHIQVIRRSLFEKLGGLRKGFEGAQDHDLALRAAPFARRVGHIPKILYHWRALPGSTALCGGEKQYSFEAARRAVQEALQRMKNPGVAIRPPWAIRNGNALFYHEFPDQGPTVTIIIPVHNRVDLLERCLSSLTATSYVDYSVLVADDESDDPSLTETIARYRHRHLRVPRVGGKFSFAHLNNKAAAACDTEFVLFLNNDTEIIDPRWLTRMMGYARMQGVGAVGALLTYNDGRIQHAGIIHAMRNGLADHAFKLLPEGNLGYMCYAGIVRNCSAVTAACLVTPRKLFLQLEGFNEKAFPVAFNDPDYCFRLGDAGYRCVICPSAHLIHHEGKTRHPGRIDQGDAPGEHAEYRRRHRHRVDPYYNPNFSLDDGWFRVYPRHVVLHRPDKVRALFFTHNLARQGAPLIFADIIANLKSRFDVEPIVISPFDGPLKTFYTERGIPVEIGHLSQLPGAENTTEPLPAAMRDLVKRYGSEVVVANTILSYDVVHTARQIGLPSIWCIHESEPCTFHFQNQPLAVQKTALACFQYPYRCVFAARATRNVYEKLNLSDNFAITPYGLDPASIAAGSARWSRAAARRQLNLPDEDVVFLTLGTVCKRKGQRDLAAALAKLDPAQASGIRILIVGEQRPEYCSLLKADLDGLDPAIRGRVVCLPETDDPALYYRAADAFVCTSRIESYPVVILEAMAHGLPIVTTPVFGIYEQVRENLNAIFYPPGDAGKLAEALKAMLDPARRTAMAAQSPQVLDSLPSHADMCEAYARFIREAAFA